MPHDKNGAVLVVGDRVNIPCLVKDVHAGEEYCNVSLETVEPMYPGDRRRGITLNARQVEKVLPEELPPAEPPPAPPQAPQPPEDLTRGDVVFVPMRVQAVLMKDGETTLALKSAPLMQLEEGTPFDRAAKFICPADHVRVLR